MQKFNYLFSLYYLISRYFKKSVELNYLIKVIINFKLFQFKNWTIWNLIDVPECNKWLTWNLLVFNSLRNSNLFCQIFEIKEWEKNKVYISTKIDDLWIFNMILAIFNMWKEKSEDYLEELIKTNILDFETFVRKMYDGDELDLNLKKKEYVWLTYSKMFENIDENIIRNEVKLISEIDF